MMIASTEALTDEMIDRALIAMQHECVKQFHPEHMEDVRPTGLLFAPSGNYDGEGDLLIMVSTTAGQGVEFGTKEVEQGIFDNAKDDDKKDLDRFVAKIRADTGAFPGALNF